MVLKVYTGFRLLFYALSITFFLVFILSVFDIITKWTSYDIEQKIIMPLGLVILLWLTLILLQFLNGYHIVLTDSEIVIRTWANDFSNIDVECGDILGQIKIPKTKSFKIDIDDIKAIKVGSLTSIKKFCHDYGEIDFASKISIFKNNLKKNSNSFTAYTINSRTYIYFELRNNTPKIVDVEFISKKRIERFIKQVMTMNKDIEYELSK